MSKQPLYEVEGRPVFYGDVLHLPPRLFNRAGPSVRAYLADDGSGEATMRSDSGAVPTVRICDLSWEPHPETIALQELEKAGFKRPTMRDVQVWLAARKQGANHE